ncbi:MAG: NAD(P)/FAD-dependent oxidoreductase [Gammaproteobacteria bacterium]|nr:NAD(P)/FAD-dependent oxidoreductase [Gammaproteobacteria bacterium]
MTSLNKSSLIADLEFDLDALRARYRAERDKRVRSDGLDQYQRIEGDLAVYDEDPYVEPGFTRAPLTDEVEVAIIGGGFGGLLAGARLRKAGVEDIRIIEKAGDFGGTWYWNRYPGAQCDVEAYIYLPLLEEMGYVPKLKYSFGPEIMAHAQAIARQFRLYDNACLQTQVTELRWDDASARWIISTHRGDRIRAHYLVMANGLLSRPKLPGIRGIQDFKGHSFHTSRWDYAYTGGSCEGDLTGLADKRVGIIGTGATAIQCVPHLGQAARQLYVFQRTPSSVDVRNNRPTDMAWAKSLTPGWHRTRMDNFNIIASGGHAEEDLIQDGWTDIFRNLQTILSSGQDTVLSSEDHAVAMEIADFRKMEQVRARADAIVKDKATAEALKPWYRQFCKRPCFNDEYLATFNRPNVKLVDTQGRGVDRVTARGLMVGATEYELDCLIYATGFEVGTNYTSQCGYEILGRGGLPLSKKWAAGMRTFHGLFTHDFPNCFFMGFTQTGYTANVPHALDEQAQHVAHVVKTALDRGVATLEASAAAEAEWVDTIHRLAVGHQQYYAECTPGYYNNEGKGVEGNGFLAGQYGGGSMAFFQLLADWRAEGNLRGLEIRRGSE